MKFKYVKLPRSSNTSEPQIPMPFLPIFLFKETFETVYPIYALLDSGADKTLMPSDLAIELGIEDFKSGHVQPTRGVGDQIVNVYYHSGVAIELVGDGRRLPLEIGFVETTPNRTILPLLGRTFFEHFKKVTFCEPKKVLELSS